MTPQVKIENGKVVIDREGMVEACAQETSHEGYEKVQEKGLRTFQSKRKYSERWSHEETEMFYTVFFTQALQIFGTDFEMIANFMKNRSRNQIKSKYKKESRNNAARMDYALWNRIPLTKEAYEEYIKTLKP